MSDEKRGATSVNGKVKFGAFLFRRVFRRDQTCQSAAMDGKKPYFLQALDVLKAGDRRGAASLLERQLREGHTALKNLPSVSQLAMQIGEIELAIEAGRMAVVPDSIESLVAFLAILGTAGRADDAVAEIRRQSASVRQHPFILHFLGTVASQNGRKEEAEALFRETLKKSPGAIRTWFALAMLKTFTAHDSDLATMERMAAVPGAPPEARASLLYGIGKAWDDIGDIDRAFRFYHQGAEIRRRERPSGGAGFAVAADEVCRGFKARSLLQLIPSGESRTRSLFVTGMPRSGTTLTEQILVSHSAVHDGAELSLYGAALLPARGTIEGAMAYQARSTSTDPWGDVARDYAGMVDAHFRTPSLVVDKSLGQSLQTGMILHASPTSRVAWLRRSPEDIALSCYTTYFTLGLPWTWSLVDIAERMLAEDRLFEHWRAIFPERILAVPYEEMVAEPDAWSLRLQAHFGLPAEEGLATTSRKDRSVRTASVGQIRDGITTGRVGRAARYERHLEPFRARYYGAATG